MPPEDRTEDYSTERLVLPLEAQKPDKASRVRNGTGKTCWKTACSLSMSPSPTRYRPRRGSPNASPYPCMRLYSRTHGLVVHGDRASQRPENYPGSRRATTASADRERSGISGPMASSHPHSAPELTHPNSTSTHKGAAMLRKPN